MGIKGDVVLNLKPTSVVTKEVAEKVAPALIEAAQNIVGDAAKNHPYTDRTGNNTKRIGWAVSPLGQPGFGQLVTAGAGTSDTTGAGSKKRDELVVLVASSSGYGGYVEVKDGYAYLRPARDREMPKLKQRLQGVL